MRCDWRELTLGEHCEITSSKRIYFSEYTTEGVPFYRSKEIIEKSEGRNITSTLYISQEKYEEIKNKFGVPAVGDMLLTSVGTIGIPYIVREQDKFYFKDGNLTWFRAFDDRLLVQYLFYWIKSDEGQRILHKIAIGTSQEALTIANLKQIKILLPPLDVQQKIASILSPLDDKIDLNRRINANLEEQARVIFSFMFPDISFGNRTIGEYITPRRGKSLLSKNAVPGNVPVIAGGTKPAAYHNVANTKPPVVTIAASGTAGYVSLWHVPVWSSDSSFIDSEMTEHVYFWYLLLSSRQEEIYRARVGSVQPHIYPQHIAEMPAGNIDMQKVREFTEKVTPLFMMIGHNKEENNALANIRDFLLPKLISGEIIP